MDIVRETNSKIKYYENRLKELELCINKKGLSKDAIHYIRDEIKTSKRNLEYYNMVLMIVKGAR